LNSGADLANLVRQAALFAIKEAMVLANGEVSAINPEEMSITMRCFERASALGRASVTRDQRERYESMRKVYDVVR